MTKPSADTGSNSIMTVDLLIDLLRSHLAALQSNAWPRPHGVSNGPALFLDADDTRALIDELASMRRLSPAAAESSSAIDR